jgi:hypothetical protein
LTDTTTTKMNEKTLSQFLKSNVYLQEIYGQQGILIKQFVLELGNQVNEQTLRNWLKQKPIVMDLLCLGLATAKKKAITKTLFQEKVEEIFK